MLLELDCFCCKILVNILLLFIFISVYSLVFVFKLIFLFV